MRIGEILLAQNKLRETELTRALAEQRETGLRLCSMLIGRGILEFDVAAAALGEQHGVPCALQKHLELRDRDLESKLPPELARASIALPIARTRSGDLIVAVRDPDPKLATALTQAARARVVLLVTPAAYLEQLVEQVYGGVPNYEQDVDLSTGPIALPPKPDMSQFDPDSIRFALTSLDDDRVSRDPSQSGQMSAALPALAPSAPAVRPPPVVPPPPAVSPPTVGTSPRPMRERSPQPSTQPIATLRDPAATVDKPSLETTMQELGLATSRDGATEVALSYIERRWVAGVVLAIRGTAAVGYRGRGPNLPAIESISIPLAERSTIQRAAETRRTAIKLAAGAVEERIESALGDPEVLAASPILLQGHVVAVIAVGDPVLGANDFDDATADLAVLAGALARAYERIHAAR